LINIFPHPQKTSELRAAETWRGTWWAKRHVFLVYLMCLQLNLGSFAWEGFYMPYFNAQEIRRYAKNDSVTKKSKESVISGLLQIFRPHFKAPSYSVAYKAMQCTFVNFEDALDEILAPPDCMSLFHRVYSFVHFSWLIYSFCSHFKVSWRFPSN
jgi:hypothetical protein